jgi:hypothetical protein
MTGFQHVDFEVGFVTAECDAGRGIQPGFENGDLIAGWNDNILSLVWIEQSGVVGSEGVFDGVCGGRMEGQQQTADCRGRQERFLHHCFLLYFVIRSSRLHYSSSRKNRVPP